LTPRVPAQRDRLPGPRGFDHRVLAGAQQHALPGLDEVIAEIAVAGQPEAAIDRGEFAAEPVQTQGLARSEGLFELRIHHQSPEWRIAMIGSITQTIQ
jgi:hypothetical protein